MSDPHPIHEKGWRALRVALVATLVAILLALVLLIKETAYTFVIFMFLGPPLLLLAAGCLVWVILQELRMKKVL
jgi:zinc transporter ZupT